MIVGFVDNIIKNIPEILQYFVSGFIFLWIFNFLRTKRNSDVSLLLIGSVVISYVIKNVVDSFGKLELRDEVLVCLSISTVFAFVAYGLYCKVFPWILRLFTNKSINDDLWRDVLDYSKGTTLKVFLKNESAFYTGDLMQHEENGLDSWILLTNYSRSYINEKREEVEEFDSDSCLSNFPKVMIPLIEVERIELFYKEDTEMFRRYPVRDSNSKRMSASIRLWKFRIPFSVFVASEKKD